MIVADFIIFSQLRIMFQKQNKNKNKMLASWSLILLL